MPKAKLQERIWTVTASGHTPVTPTPRDTEWEDRELEARRVSTATQKQEKQKLRHAECVFCFSFLRGSPWAPESVLDLSRIQLQIPRTSSETSLWF